MNFNGITHIISNPSGHADGYNFGLVGSVSSDMLREALATPADIRGGRAHADRGCLVTYRPRPWRTVQEILDVAATLPHVVMCSDALCACRKLF